MRMPNVDEQARLAHRTVAHARGSGEEQLFRLHSITETGLMSSATQRRPSRLICENCVAIGPNSLRRDRLTDPARDSPNTRLTGPPL